LCSHLLAADDLEAAGVPDLAVADCYATPRRRSNAPSPRADRERPGSSSAVSLTVAPSV
jgi:hypothetical protein